MSKKQHSLTLGVEEELFVVDTKSGKMVDELPKELLKNCGQQFPEQIIPEFLSSQVELITKPCQDVHELAQQMSELRHCLVKESSYYDLSPIAASTHPQACWRTQQPNMSPRYEQIANTLQIAASRMLVGGLHIHVGLNDNDERIKVLNALTWYLPLLLSLSTSSPFWAGMDTGLNSFRLSVIDGLPRCGLPQQFTNYHHYENYLYTLIETKAIDDGREIWWDARLSYRFPTVEMRITDICTDIKDTLAIAALYQSLVLFILEGKSRHREQFLLHMLAHENRWRAQRYSVTTGSLIDNTENKLSSYRTIIEDLLNVLEGYSNRLGNWEYLSHLINIVDEGTSADKQRKIFTAAIQQGDDTNAAFSKVISHLIRSTRQLPNRKANKKKTNSRNELISPV